MSEIIPEITAFPERRFLGVAQYGNPGNFCIGEFWNVFFELSEIDKDAFSNVAYGIQFYNPAEGKQNEIFYFASFPADDVKAHSDRLLEKTIPALTFAVFKSPRGLQTYRDAWSASREWVAASTEYDRAGPFDMEVTSPDESVSGYGPDVWIHVPVKKK
jgi:predicted transcriptional regulator YdeE